MSKFRDFDEFRAEAAKTGPTIRLFDEEWSLPPSLPLALMVQAARLQAAAVDPDVKIEPHELIELAEGVFTAPVVTEWTARGMDVDLLAEIIGWLPDAYSSDDEDGADPGN